MATGCSAFLANWLAVIISQNQPVLKLEVTIYPTREIQGLVELDDNTPCGNPAAHKLEAAPHNQTGYGARRYGRVGMALVVRMALECFLRGQGDFSIQTTPRNIAFYTKLHFVESKRVRGRMYLSRADAERLLTEFFFG